LRFATKAIRGTHHFASFIAVDIITRTAS